MVSLRNADEEAGEVEKGGARQDAGGQREGAQGRCHSRAPVAGAGMRGGRFETRLRKRRGLGLFGHDAPPQ